MFETTNQLCMCWHIWTANRAIYATSAPTRHPPHPRDRLSRDDPPETFLSVRRSCSWPSGNVLLVAIENCPQKQLIYVDLPNLKMVIVHSYVSLPEGIFFVYRARSQGENVPLTTDETAEQHVKEKHRYKRSESPAQKFCTS